MAISVDRLKLPDFNFDWINVSDQVIGKLFVKFFKNNFLFSSLFFFNLKKADLVNLTETNKFISFFVVLLIWELIPTFVIIYLFRLQRNTSSSSTTLNINTSNSFAKKSVFLDSKVYTESNNDYYENYTYNNPNENRRLLNDDDDDLDTNDIDYVIDRTNVYYNSINA